MGVPSRRRGGGHDGLSIRPCAISHEVIDSSSPAMNVCSQTVPHHKRSSDLRETHADNLNMACSDTPRMAWILAHQVLADKMSRIKTLDLDTVMEMIRHEIPALPILWFSRGGLLDVDRRAVEQFGIPVLVLMENAGRQVAEVTRSYMMEGASVLILAGAGNNGGDGLVAARHLANRGCRVEILLIMDENKFTGAAQSQLKIIGKMGLPVTILSQQPEGFSQWLAHSDVGDAVVDAMFGTGLNRPLTGPVKDLIVQLNQSNRRVISVDIPSGLDCDTGKPLGIAVQAVHTVSFCGMKIGFELPEAIRYLGQISIGDIGAPMALLQACAEKE